MGRTTPPPAARRGCAAGTSVDPLPYALEARYRLKRGMAWIGYQVHRTEPCDDDPPHVITHGETTLAPTADDKMLETIHAALAEHPLLPHEHLVDCGYTDSEILVGSDQAYGGTIVGPVAADPSWQAREATGLANSAFTINGETHTATCPQGKQSRKWHPDTDVAGQDVVQIRFAKKDCQVCALRSACTRAKTEPRTLTVRTPGYHEVLQAARQRQKTVEFQEQDAKRAGIEGTLSQGVRAFDRRRSRYLGLAKTHLQHIRIAAAITLVRVVAWLTDPRPQKRRAAPLAALAFAAQEFANRVNTQSRRDLPHPGETSPLWEDGERRGQIPVHPSRGDRDASAPSCSGRDGQDRLMSATE